MDPKDDHSPSTIESPFVRKLNPERDITTKKLQPPEAVGHSEGCCSPQNTYRFAQAERAGNTFLKKIAPTLSPQKF